MAKLARLRFRGIAVLAAVLFGATAARAQAAPAHGDGPDTQPVLLNARDVARIVTRAYPVSLRTQAVQGSAEVYMKIDADGTVDTTTLTVRNATSPEFVPAAMKVVAKLRFRPATLGGQPVPVWVTYPIAFDPPSTGTSRDIQRDNRIMKGELPPPTMRP